ncbi:hypothetical protein V6U81_17725 [Micromonospora sp. CPCC 205711]|uniref:hypothetical protein n=1 Tax=Micromonospora sp. CPCC 205547 TaxID=3122400 RepID=UPI002FEEE50C
MTATVALVFAVAAAVGYGLGSVLQAVGARRGRSTLRALGHPLYLAGLACDTLAFLASLVALRRLPVYEVQSVTAGSLAVTAVLARVVLAARLRRRDTAAIVATVAALVVISLSAGAERAVVPSVALATGLAAAALVTTVAGVLAARRVSPVLSAALAGAAWAVTALCARALVLPADPLGRPVAAVWELALDPILWGLLVSGVAGTLLYAHSLRYGQVGPVTAVLWAVEVVAPSVAGVLLLGDGVRAGWLPWVVAAILVTVVAAVVLATAPATVDTTREAAG